MDGGEGYTPIKLKVRNNNNGDIKAVTLNQGYSKAILGLDACIHR